VDVTVRLVETGDAATLVQLLRDNRAFLEPWEPRRDDTYFTEHQQQRELDQILAKHRQGLAVPYVVQLQGQVVGRVTVADVVRSAFQSAHLGYWVDQRHQGRGVATAAVGEVVRRAFTELGLHRLEAATLEHNAASRRVLARNGFVEIGLAPQYLRIAGRWQDHLLHQRLNEQWTTTRA
jgi:ribosomal-protein-alanine N-acetyltransferase